MHSLPLLQALADNHVSDVHLVTEEGVSQRRLDSGWGDAATNGVHVWTAPTLAQRRQLEQGFGPEYAHVFSGLGAYQETSQSFSRVRERRLGLVGVWVEPWQTGGAKGLARRIRYRMAAAKINHDVDFVLAMGALGRHQYARVGFPKASIFPFSYFVVPSIRPDQGGSGESKAAGGPQRRLIFVGRLVGLKRLDWVLQGLRGLDDPDVALTVVGDGPRRPQLERLSTRLGVSRQVEWMGTVRSDGVRSLIAESDLLVLPSSYDGWGAVVNEALSEGTPALVSDGAGSAELMQEPFLGQSFVRNSRRDFETKLELGLRTGPDSALRHKIRAWERSACSPAAGALYFTELMDSLRTHRLAPTAPWLTP